MAVRGREPPRALLEQGWGDWLMQLRSFAPGLAPRKITGSRFEPGHRQRVRLHLDGDWLDGVYNRKTCRFWVRHLDGWDELDAGEVKWWTQAQILPAPDPEIETFDEPSAPAWRVQAQKVLDMRSHAD